MARPPQKKSKRMFFSMRYVGRFLAQPPDSSIGISTIAKKAARPIVNKNNRHFFTISRFFVRLRLIKKLRLANKLAAGANLN